MSAIALSPCGLRTGCDGLEGRRSVSQRETLRDAVPATRTVRGIDPCNSWVGSPLGTSENACIFGLLW